MSENTELCPNLISDSGPKPKCLIGLYGLHRTFKESSKHLFEKIIDPNKDKYDFDIIINTDFNGRCCGPMRPDITKTGVSKYKYHTEKSLLNDLYIYYNKYDQLREVIIYNYDNTTIMRSWWLVYKRIQSILIKAFQSKKKYDIYIMHRIDAVLDKVLYLDDIKNELLLITSISTRPAYLHNRDMMDLVMCGNFKPFMSWNYNIINFFDSIVSKNEALSMFYSKEKFCDNDIIELLNIENSIMKSCDKFQNIKEILKLRHTPRVIIGYYFCNETNQIKKINHSELWGISSDDLVEGILKCARVLFIGNSTLVLSENKENPIHTTILR